MPPNVKFAIVPVIDDKPLNTYPTIAYMTQEDIKRYRLDDKFNSMQVNRGQDFDFDESEV